MDRLKFIFPKLCEILILYLDIVRHKVDDMLFRNNLII
jgi:hypothetical protein